MNYEISFVISEVQNYNHHLILRAKSCAHYRELKLITTKFLFCNGDPFTITGIDSE